jgi:phosphatidylinositol alpha-1,6-mannosyltransferase
MIRALHRIRSAVPDVLYAIVGAGEEIGALQELVRAERLEGHVLFHGKLDDAEIVQCYQQCDLFVLPNRQVGEDIEGFGMVLLEAQACGRPVVAGASGGTAETLKDPETGRVVCCDRHEELAEVVVELLSDPGRLAEMGARGRSWAVDRFDWELVGRRAYDLFEGREARPMADHTPAATGALATPSRPLMSGRKHDGP